jgi:hypothetical protein
MLRRWRWARRLAVLVGFAQIAIPNALLIADAIEARSPGASVVHVEESSASGCRAAHSAECSICRFLSTNVTTAAASPPIACARTLHRGITLSRAERPNSGAFALPLSRAPPVL